jgi:hypothetical protein
MSYSGTVGQTVVTVQNFIDQGARLSGKLAEELTVEQVQGSKQALFFVLSNLINQGINYWAINKQVYGLIPDQYEYLLPVGGVDVLNALYRTITQPSGSYSASDGSGVSNIYDDNIQTYNQMTVANGSYQVNYGTNNSQYIGSIGFMPYISGGGTATWNYTLQYSYDGTTWVTLYTGTSVVVQDGQWVWQDIDPGATAQYYRMQATNGTTLALRELYFGVNTTEVTMSRLNRDDYTNLPNKNFTANQPYQFWLNRTIPQAKITLWPAPSNAFVQMTVWYSRQIDDVGSLNGQLEIPQRWNQAIQYLLAHQMSLILPGVDIARIQYLEGQAEKYFIMAENEERDKSPIYFAPNISVYTR